MRKVKQISYEPIAEELQNAQPADWVLEMTRFYNENGYYRPEDLNRLLGDPCKGVTLPSSDEDAKKILEEIFSGD